MKKKTANIILLALLMSFGLNTTAQVAINNDGSSPDASAMLEIKSVNKGFLPPRMNATQMKDISSPQAGLMVFNTTVNSICYYDGSIWNNLNNIDGKSGENITYDGQTYETVIIGTQCWMTENLNVGTAILGSSSPSNNGTIEKYCYDDSTDSCDTYGGLYQWAEMVQYENGATNTTSWDPVPTGNVQGICPDGWHLPTDAEWVTLSNYLDGGNVAGGKMKETGTEHWTSPNAGATNSSGFTGLPGGYHNSTGACILLGDIGFWWSSSELSGTEAWYRYLSSSYYKVTRDFTSKTLSLSVRCLKN